MTTLVEPRRVSGGEHEHGHLEELRTDPIALMRRVREECGDVGVFQLADKKVVLLSGAEANEFFFRAADEDLDQQAAYPFMKPVFGEGVVFDASPERRKEMLHNSALRGEQMRGHAATIDREVQDMVAGWGDEGDIDLLEFFAEMTIYTSSACLIGKKFRDQLDGRFAHLYHDLEKGTDALAFVDPYAPIESFRRRDEARHGLVALVQEIMDGRIANPPQGKEDRDMLDVLVSIKDEDGKERFSADEITGIFISMMFAGHHTTSGTAAWALIELLRNPEYMQQVTAELDVLYSDGESVSSMHCADPGARSGAQGDAAPAPATDPASSGRARRLRGRRIPDLGGRSRGCDTGDLQPDPGGLPGSRCLRSRPLHRPQPGGHRQPVDLDSVRGGSAPLCGSGVRAHAAEGDILGSAARLRVRTVPAARDLPQRPLEDGGPARTAVCCAVPASHPGGIRHRHSDAGVRFG